MPSTNTHDCVIQADTEAEYLRVVQQIDTYMALGRQPPLQNRVDDAANRRITARYVETLNLG